VKISRKWGLSIMRHAAFKGVFDEKELGIVSAKTFSGKG
jgi:hypothetical protein